MIARQIKVLISSYRKDDYADPDGFVVQVGALMEQYPERVIAEATDVREARSIQRVHPSFPPNVGEVALVLEAVAKHQHEMIVAANAPKPVRYQPREIVLTPGCRANVFIGNDMPFYETAKAWAENPNADQLDWRFGDLRGKPGIWIAHSIWESVVRPGGARQLDKTWKSPSDAELRAKYDRREVEAARVAQSGESA